MESVPARDHNKILGRELSATLVAAALKNVATGFVSHALEEAVLAGTLMAAKAAEIFVGAAAISAVPRFLTAAQVERIAGRPDEHYRQKALGL